MAPGLCLLSRGFVPGVRARGGRAQLCVGLCLATAVIVFRSDSLQLWAELLALAPGARCQVGRSVGSGAPEAMQWTATLNNRRHARNVTSGQKCWSRGRIVSALLSGAQGGCLPSVEPPNPVAPRWAGHRKPARTAAASAPFVTGGNRVFMKEDSCRICFGPGRCDHGSAAKFHGSSLTPRRRLANPWG